MRIVLKLGTSTLTHPKGNLKIRSVEEMCKVCSDLKNAEHELVLVSSGAVAMGVGKLSLAERPTFREASQLAERLMRMYAEREIDRVELVYNHFKSTASQVLRREEYLPLQVEPAKTKGVAADYIVEPSREEVIRTLVPQVLSLKIFTMLLDSNAAEHAARTIAMQMATDNATELLQELTVQYNKSRQQIITNE